MSKNLEAFQDYLTLEKHYSLLTVKAYSSDITEFERFITNNSGVVLEEIVYSDVRLWIVSMLNHGVSNATVNRKISSLKAFYKFLMKIGALDVSPLLKHKSLKVSRKVQIPFSEQELNQVLTLIPYPDGFEGIRDKLIIDFFYTTGIRRAELIHLLNKDIDLSQCTIKVLGKRNKERILPILPVLVGQIKRYREVAAELNMIKGPYLFVNNKGEKLGESFVYRVINKYFSNVSEKVKKSPHILRHTFATHMLNNGADLNSVKELLGHSSLAATQIYTHSSLAELKKVYQNAHPRN